MPDSQTDKKGLTDFLADSLRSCVVSKAWARMEQEAEEDRSQDNTDGDVSGQAT